MGALLRLVRQALLRSSGNLGELEAALVCPMLLPPADMTTRCGQAALPAERRELVALALWHAVNWLRETLNTFSGNPPMNTCAFQFSCLALVSAGAGAGAVAGI